MNENVQKSLVMGASILVTIGIISLGLMIFSQGSSLVKESSKNMVDLTQELASQKYIAYDNSIVSGSEVINAINTYAKNGVTVKCKTLSATAEKEYTTSYSNNDVTDKDYINANGMFESTLVANSNGVVQSISFKQI
ncbi:MAG: hypothetical protein MJ246_05465 [Clostridia bacterium]|nr:hypothetical protein [Clostridia bacterium]